MLTMLVNKVEKTSVINFFMVGWMGGERDDDEYLRAIIALTVPRVVWNYFRISICYSQPAYREVVLKSVPDLRQLKKAWPYLANSFREVLRISKTAT